jgi:Ser/Thr protein kinase RdoA (MazF antagonist)
MPDVPPFDQLTQRGQRQRLRALALEALARYGVEVQRCSFLTQSYNTLFRVDATDGSRYALRVSPAEIIQAEGIEGIEAAWLRTLRQDTDLSVARVNEAADGSVMVKATVPEVPGQRRCTLFDWVPGRPMNERISRDLVLKAGRLSASVHEHGAAHAPPTPPPVLVADRAIYWKLEPMLDTLTPEYGNLFTEALDRVDRVIAGIWQHPPHPPHLLHGDVTPNNLMTDRGIVTLIDFQDTIWGFEVQDVAITIASLRIFEDADGLANAFRTGYEQVRRWPCEDPTALEALVVARRLDMLNYALYLRRSDLDTHVPAVAALVAGWMRLSPPVSVARTGLRRH